MTDCIIPKSSYLPIDHKMASNTYFYCRIHTYIPEKAEKETKPNTVRNILYNNQNNKNILNGICKKRKINKEDEEHPEKKHRKWVIFTYFGEGTNS